MEKPLSLREARVSEELTNVSLIVPKSLISVMKKILFNHHLTVPRAKYELVEAPLKVSQGTGVSSTYSSEQYYKIPTNIRAWPCEEKEYQGDNTLSVDCGLENFRDHIDWVFEPKKAARSPNKLENLIRDWIKNMPIENLDPVTSTALQRASYKYRQFDTLLLLPSEAIQYLDGLSRHPQIHALYKEISKAFKRRRIAVNAPIPALQSRETCSSVSDQPISVENTKRLPLNFTPLYGDFGCLVPREPTDRDLMDAYWERTCQNGIWQIWAPLYTMFSSGNLSEKKRVLELKSLETQKNACTTVDLYAGIGYFAFSYVRAGASKVLCWEINSWSVEGMRRGAKANGWECKVVSGSGQIHGDDLEGDVKLIAFHESNEKAIGRVNTVRSSIPPVRHVNCGSLPSSEPSWKTAVNVLDLEQGGWVHVHENVDQSAVAHRREEVISKIQRLIQELHGSLPTKYNLPKVSCEHLEMVKSYSPRVKHWVFDILVGPSSRTEPQAERSKKSESRP